MADKDLINGRAAVPAGSAGKSVAFPDTNDHKAKVPGNTPPVPWMSTMLPGGEPVPIEYALETPAKKRITGKR
jgi:hypothetical protein